MSEPPRPGVAARLPAARAIDDATMWTVLESSPDALILCDDDGLIVYANRQLETLSGFDRAELLGQPVESIVPLDVRGQHRSLRLGYRVAPQTRAMGRGIELRLQRKDSSIVPVEIALAPVRSGSERLVIATVRDVTEQRRADRQRAQLLDLLDFVPPAVLVYDAATCRVEYANAAAAELLGYEHDQLLNMTLFHFSPRATPDNVASLRRQLRDKGSTATFTGAVVRRADGTDISIETAIRETVDHPGGAPRWVAVLQDVTDRLRDLALLKASEEAFRTAFQQAPVGMALVSLTDPQHRVIEWANDTLAAMLGTHVDVLVGQDFADLSHPDDRSEADDHAAAQMARGERRHHHREKRYRRADGSYVWTELRATAVIDPANRVARALAHITDISERRRQRELAERRLDLQAELRDVASALLSGTAEHDALAQVAQAAAKVLRTADAAIMTRQRTGRFATTVSVGINAQHLSDFAIDDDSSPDLATSLEIGVVTCGDGPATESLSDYVGPWLITPLAIGQTIIGLLCVSRRRGGDPFDEVEQQIARDFAREASALIALSRTRRFAEQMHLVDERERIARDVHDHTIQRLFATGLALQGIAARSDGTTQTRLIKFVDEIDASIKQLRGLIFHLNESPGNEPLSSVLSRAIDSAPCRDGCTVRADVRCEIESIDDERREALIAVLHEALANVARHAEASTADVTVRISGDRCELRIEDNGIGSGPAERSGGNGVRNMRSRARSLGGDCSVADRPAGGTIVAWTIPTT